MGWKDGWVCGRPDRARAIRTHSSATLSPMGSCLRRTTCGEQSTHDRRLLGGQPDCRLKQSLAREFASDRESSLLITALDPADSTYTIHPDGLGHQADRRKDEFNLNLGPQGRTFGGENENPPLAQIRALSSGV